MRLVWADEGAGEPGAPPDPDLWAWRRVDEWHPPDELQTYTDDPANAHYDGHGHLVLRALSGQGARRYTSARLSTHHANRPSMFLYGYFAARIRVPTGRGIWPAWWLLGPDGVFGWPECGEIDVMEAPSSATTAGEVHQGTHAPRSDGSGVLSAGVPPSVAEWGDDFHTYAVVWTPGRDVTARGGRWVFDDRPQAPVLSLAVGGWAGLPDGSWSEQTMLVDWVRIYQD
jgi:beta-glucanase (GH16 family)